MDAAALMANVLFFATIQFLCGFAPNYTMFFILRALFGIGMGGEWGVGASMVMDHAPVRWRGVLSGILQSGYSIGYLLAAFAARLVLPSWGLARHVLGRWTSRSAGSLYSH
jgi:MFS transporter, SHS family, lactate transporter